MKKQDSAVIPLALSSVATFIVIAGSIAGYSRPMWWLMVGAGVAFTISLVWFVVLAIAERRHDTGNR